MNVHSTADQARHFALTQAVTGVRRKLEVLTHELSSGRHHDLAAALDGNTRLLRHHEAQKARVEGFLNSAAEAATTTEGMRLTLDVIEATTRGLGLSLINEGNTGSPATLQIWSEAGATAFSDTVSRLNSTIAGAHIFGGAVTDKPPLMSAQAILTQLETLTAAQTTAAGVENALNTWFDSPAGTGQFADTAYQGSPDTLRQIPIGENEEVTIGLTGLSPAIRNVLKGLAMTALVARGALASNPAEQRALIGLAGNHTVSAHSDLITEQGRVGALEARIARARSEHAAQSTVLGIAIADLVSKDAYTTATELGEAETHMQTLYTLTGRLSSLKLVNYLR